MSGDAALVITGLLVAAAIGAGSLLGRAIAGRRAIVAAALSYVFAWVCLLVVFTTLVAWVSDIASWTDGVVQSARSGSIGGVRTMTANMPRLYWDLSYKEVEADALISAPLALFSVPFGWGLSFFSFHIKVRR